MVRFVIIFEVTVLAFTLLLVAGLMLFEVVLILIGCIIAVLVLLATAKLLVAAGFVVMFFAGSEATILEFSFFEIAEFAVEVSKVSFLVFSGSETVSEVFSFSMFS